MKALRAEILSLFCHHAANHSYSPTYKGHVAMNAPPPKKKQICICLILCFADHASRYNRTKRNQLDEQLILSIFRQPVHVSGVSRPIFRRYNRMYTPFGTYYSFQKTVFQPGQQTAI